MLTPKYLDSMPEALVELYSKVEIDILKDMARRISTYDYWIPAAEHQNKMLQEMGATQDYVLAQMAKLTGKSRKEITDLFVAGIKEGVETDRRIYFGAGLKPPTIDTSENLQAVIHAGMKQTNQVFRNLTGTTAYGAYQQLGQVLDEAWLKINTGGFDSNAAIRSAIKELSAQGIQTVEYRSGAKATLEVAVRRAIVTGVNQTALRTQWALADEMECDLVEVTAHAGARPGHAVWQGGIYSRSGRSKKYPEFVRTTGYGTGAGLGGWNCRHSFFPYLDGTARTYTKKQLAEYNEKKYIYQGEKLTEYEASQKQRYLERQIRRWKRENVAMEAAGLDTTESAVKISQWQNTQKEFLQQTGLKRQPDREQIADWGKGQAISVSSQVRNTERVANAIFSLGGTKENVAMYIKEKAVIDTLQVYGIKYIQRINKDEIIVNAGKPKISGMTKHATENLENKPDRANMTEEMAQIFVNNAKLVLYQPKNKTIKFIANNGYTVLNFHRAVVTITPQKWRKKYDKYIEEE